MRNPSGVAHRIVVYQAAFAMAAVYLALLLRFDTGVSLCGQMLVPSGCESVPPALSDAGLIALTALGALPILALLDRRLRPLAPAGFTAYAVTLPVLLVWFHPGFVSAYSVWLAALGITVGATGALFVLGAGAAAPPASGIASPDRVGNNGDIRSRTGRWPPQGAANRAANIVAVSLGIVAVAATLVEYTILTSVVCPEVCVPMAPPAAVNLGLGVALLTGALPIVAASDRRMRHFVPLGLVSYAATSFVWIEVSPAGIGFIGDPLGVATLTVFGLLALTGLYFLVLSPPVPPPIETPQSAVV